jgi:hypothetical protein
MQSNLYHLLAFLPATEAWEMPPPLEALAQQLVKSGKLRINADTTRNFVRYGTVNSDITFTQRELTDATLAATTRAKVARLVAPAMGEQGIADIWAHLRNELKKARGVSAEKEMRVARVLVQSAHPSVIQLLIAGGTEVFVSYAHNVADLMAVQEWEKNGQNSGMQATETSGTAVYVSAGGDPFFEGEQRTYVTDGFPSLARMIVIAGQELGHFSDLRRSPRGIIGRWSTDIHHTRLRADPVARDGRLSDMRHVAFLEKSYQSVGLARLRRAEKGVAFYHQRLRFSPPWFFYQLYRWAVWTLFTHRCRKRNLLTKFMIFPHMRLGDAIENYLSDMAFNLAPEAEVYRDPDPLVEEAIAVIEAVARVPQQVHKWGYSGVAQAWPALNRFYFETVIPACMAVLEHPLRPQTLSLLQQLNIRWHRLWRKRPDYYPQAKTGQKQGKISDQMV